MRQTAIIGLTTVLAFAGFTIAQPKVRIGDHVYHVLPDANLGAVVVRGSIATGETEYRLPRPIIETEMKTVKKLKAENRSEPDGYYDKQLASLKAILAKEWLTQDEFEQIGGFSGGPFGDLSDIRRAVETIKGAVQQIERNTNK